MNARVTALVVTYNRKALLSRCLTALQGQSRKPDRILVVDNASTDGTREMLTAAGWLSRPDFRLLALPENTGGAGGFAAGIRRAVEDGADWVWLMDDDAVPRPDALEMLFPALVDRGALYGSVAVSGDGLAWPMSPEKGSSADVIDHVDGLPGLMKVLFIPFLGLAVSRDLVGRIGVPDPGFFIAADDLDYCLRARAAGAEVWLVGSSRIDHPASVRHRVELPWGTHASLVLPPWKRYYDVRNRLLVARNHYGWALLYRTLPGQCLRLLITLLHEPQPARQLHAFMAGMIDGLLGRKGRRHERWGLGN